MSFKGAFESPCNHCGQDHGVEDCPHLKKGKSMNSGIDHKARQTGAVIVFNPGVTPEQAERLLNKLAEQLKLESVNVQEFNPTYGSPVFYVP